MSNTNNPEETTPVLPPQQSPRDTSNWDDRAFTTPTGRIVIETTQDSDTSNIVGE